jgi:hypothetical protein
MKARERHPLIRWMLRATVGFQLCLPVGIYLVYAYLTPGSGPAQWWFVRSYERAANRSLAIRNYQSHLTRISGHLPEEIRNFLLERFEQSHGTPEGDAVLDLFLHEGAARASWPFLRSPEEVRGLMIGNILKRPQIGVDELLFVEWLRRGEVLGKGGFSLRQPPAPGDLAAWRDDAAHSQERRTAAYRKWWGDGSRWPENEDEEPLAGTPDVVRSFAP